MKGPDTLQPSPDEAPSQSPPAPAWGPLALAMGAWLWASWALLAWHQSPMDEANQLAQAWRVAQGATLYGDLWEFAGPLPLVVMAGVYRCLGPGLESARVLAALILGANMALVARLAWRLGASPWGACWAACVVALGATPYLRAYYHHWGAWALALAAWNWVALPKATSEGPPPHSGPGAFLWAGFLAGLAAWANLMVGAAAGLALACGALALPWAQLGRRWGLLLLGFGLTLAAGSVLFAPRGDLAALWQHIFWWPATHYKQAGGINDVAPFSDWGSFLRQGGQSPGLWAWDVASKVGLQVLHGLGPLVFLCLAGARLMGAGQASKAQGPWPLFWLVGVGACLGTALAWKGRADHTHLALACLPSLPLLASLWPRRGRWAGVVLLLLLVGQEFRSARAFWQEGRLGWGLDASIARSEGIQWFRAQLPEGGRVQSFPCDGLLHLFSSARLASPYALVHPVGARYWHEAEHERFRRMMLADPPDLIWVSGPWIGQEDLKLLVGPRLWSQYRWRHHATGWVSGDAYTRIPQAQAGPRPAR